MNTQEDRQLQESIDKRNAAVMKLEAERDRLKAENAELRAALANMFSYMESVHSDSDDGELTERREAFPAEWRLIDAARAALAKARG